MDPLVKPENDGGMGWVLGRFTMNENHKSSEETEEEFMNSYQVGSETGLTSQTILKYARRFEPYVPQKREGRSLVFPLEALKRIRLIRKMLESGKTMDEVELRLQKRFPDQAPAVLPVEKTEPKTNSSKSRLKAPSSKGLPLLQRVSILEKQIAQIQEVQELKKEVQRLRKLIEG
jgi:DNA-binding transcriptional MerR regulator